jgi:hypothetical protein
MRDACIQADGAEGGPRLRDFDWGVVVGDKQRVGLVPARAPDPDTMLGEPGDYEGADLHPHTSLKPVVLATQGPLNTHASLSAQWVPWSLTTGVLSGLAMQSVLGIRASESKRWASWSFIAGDPWLAGSALSAEGIAVQHAVEPSGESWIRFGRFGESELILRFEVPADPGLEPWPVALKHISGTRDYYPHQGQVVLALTLDGWEVTGRHAAAVPRGWVSRFELPSGRLGVGEHELRIRLHRNTMTTYRLKWVAIGHDAVDAMTR